jgi:outer membrane protein assembly factor BamB
MNRMLLEANFGLLASLVVGTVWGQQLSEPRTQLTSPITMAQAAASVQKPASTTAGSIRSKTAPVSRTAEAGNWPSFRGPSGQGRSAARGLPVEWSVTQNVAWKTALPGPGASSPVVFGDRIYITCYSGYLVPGQPPGDVENLKRHLVAIDKRDGGIVWNRSAPAKLPEENRIRDHGYAASTPAVDPRRVYVFYGKSGVMAFDHDGRPKWTANVGTATHGWGSAASVTLHKNLVLINASVESESLVALDCTSGKEKWRARGIKESWNTPLVVTAPSGREEVVIAVHGKVLAFDPASGRQFWSCDTDIGWYMVPSLIAHDGIVYCLGGRSGTASLAVRAGGEGDVTNSHRLWTSSKGSNVSSPIYHDDHLYWVHDQLGIAFSVQAASGEVVYEERLPRAGQVYSSALLADGKIYCLARNGRTFVLAARPEFEQLAVNDLNDGSLFNGSMAVDGKRLLLRSDTHLYCIGK